MHRRFDKHWSFSVERGLYYVGLPNLNITFNGSACDSHYPQPLGCQTITTAARFQADLEVFTPRQNHNLSYYPNGDLSATANGTGSPTTQ